MLMSCSVLCLWCCLQDDLANTLFKQISDAYEQQSVRVKQFYQTAGELLDPRSCLTRQLVHTQRLVAY
jgi:hypothetical protein